MYGIAKVNSDLGAIIQLLTAISFEGGDGTATVTYWDGTDDNAYVASVDSGTPIDSPALPSRPPVGDWFKFYLKTNGTTTEAGWKNLSTPGAWVSQTCTALNGTQATTFNAIEITSNSNPLNSDFEVWRCANGSLAQSVIDADLDKSRTGIAGVFDWRLFSTTNLVEYSGSGSTLTSQGGSLSNGDSWNTFPGDAAFAPRPPRTAMRLPGSSRGQMRAFFRQPQATTQASADVTLALTGVAATGAVGNLGDAISYALTGNAATGSVGNLGDAISYALTGNAASGGVGSVVPSIAYALTGNAATGAPGSLAAGVSYALTGNAATGNVGAVVSDISYGLTGNQATGAVGTLSTGNDASAALTGVSATGQVGTLGVSITYALTGVSAAGSVGSLLASITQPVTGNQATGSVGSLGDAVSYGLTGVQATGEVGTLGVPGDVTKALTGVSAEGQVGNLTPALEATTGQDGASPTRPRKRRRPVDDSPEVFEPQKVEQPQPESAEPEAPAVVMRKTSERIRALVEQIARQRQAPVIKPRTFTTELALIDQRVRQLAEQEIEDEDDAAAAEAASMLLNS